VLDTCPVCVLATSSFVDSLFVLLEASPSDLSLLSGAILSAIGERALQDLLH